MSYNLYMLDTISLIKPAEQTRYDTIFKDLKEVKNKLRQEVVSKG